MIIHTIGHSNHSFEKFVGLLSRYAIDCVIDVRSRPFGRFVPQFNRKRLQASLAESGIGYEWHGEALGGMDRETWDYHGKVGPLLAHAREERRICVMCMERKPQECHRSEIADALCAEGAEVTHILPDGSAVDHVVRRESEGVAVEDVADTGKSESTSEPKAKREKLSLEEIYERLERVKLGLGAAVAEFYRRCQELRIRRSPTALKSISLQYADDVLGNLNFGIIYYDGVLDTSYVCDSASTAGDISIGENYIADLAELIPGGEVVESGKVWIYKSVAVAEGNSPLVETVLPQHSDEWLALIDKTLDRFMELRKRKK